MAGVSIPGFLPMLDGSFGLSMGSSLIGLFIDHDIASSNSRSTLHATAVEQPLES